MKVIVAGSRGFHNYELLKSSLDKILQNQTDIEIVSGGARGADLLGERYAQEKGYSIKIFLADWERLGKRAGFFRNKEMAKYADACVCFWDGKSRGTKSMIELAKKHELKTRTIRYEAPKVLQRD